MPHRAYEQANYREGIGSRIWNALKPRIDDPAPAIMGGAGHHPTAQVPQVFETNYGRDDYRVSVAQQLGEGAHPHATGDRRADYGGMGSGAHPHATPTGYEYVGDPVQDRAVGAQAQDDTVVVTDDGHHVSSSPSGTGYSLSDTGIPEVPDLRPELSPEDIASMREEAEMYGEMEFAGQLGELERALRENKRLAEQSLDRLRTQHETARDRSSMLADRTIDDITPEYEKSMREVAGNVANAIGDYAQRMNVGGRLEGGQYGEGVQHLQRAGLEQRGGLRRDLGDFVSGVREEESAFERELERELTQRTGEVQQATDSYKRNVMDLRAQLQREQGLKEAVTFERLKREELQRERDIRQQTFQNEMQRESFNAQMDQMIWERGMQEQRLAAELEGMSLQRQMTEARIQQMSAPQAAGPQRYIPTEIGGHQVDMTVPEYMSTYGDRGQSALDRLHEARDMKIAEMTLRELGVNPESVVQRTHQPVSAQPPATSTRGATGQTYGRVRL